MLRVAHRQRVDGFEQVVVMIISCHKAQGDFPCLVVVLRPKQWKKISSHFQTGPRPRMSTTTTCQARHYSPISNDSSQCPSTKVPTLRTHTTSSPIPPSTSYGPKGPVTSSASRQPNRAFRLSCWLNTIPKRKLASCGSNACLNKRLQTGKNVEPEKVKKKMHWRIKQGREDLVEQD